MTTTTTHESIHDIKINAKEQYTKLKEAVLSYLANEGEDIETLITAQEQLAPGNNRDYYTEEIVANTVQTILDDPESLNKFADRFMQNEEDRSAFKKLLDSIKTWLKKIVDSLRGYDENEYIDSISRKLNEIDDIREKYFNGLEEIRIKDAKGGEIRYSKAKSFSEQVDDVLNGVHNPRLDLYVSKTPDYLLNLNFSDGPLLMRNGKVNEILGKHDDMSDSIIKAIPDAIKDPLLVLKSKTNPKDSVVIITDIMTSKGNMIVPVWVNQESNYIDLEMGEIVSENNFVASAYGRNLKGLLEYAANNDGFLYQSQNNDKVRQLLARNELQLLTPLKLSDSEITIAQAKDDVNTNIRKNFKNDTKNLVDSDTRTTEEVASELEARSMLSKEYDKTKGNSEADEILAMWAELSDTIKEDKEQRKAAQLEQEELKQQREKEMKSRLYNLGDDLPEAKGNVYENARDKEVNKLIKKYSSKANETEIADLIDSFMQSERNEERSIEDLREISDEITQKLISESRIKDREHDKEVKPIRDALKGRKIALNNEQIAEVESWYGSVAEFKKAIGNYITIRNEGESLDSVWQEMAEMFPDTFDKETADVDMPTELEGIADYLRPRVLDNQFKFDEVREEVFNELYEACEKINDALIRDTSESADIIVTAFNLHAGEITYAKKIAAGEADIKNINPQFDKTGVRRLAQYFAAHPEALEKYTDGTYDLAKIKAQTTAQANYKKAQEQIARLDMENAKKDAKIAQIREQQRKRNAQRKETEVKRKLRNNIKKNLNNILSRVENPTNSKHIPVGFENLAAQTLSTFQPDGQNNETQEGVKFRDRLNGLEIALRDMREKDEVNSMFAIEAISKLQELKERAGETVYLQQADEKTLKAADDLFKIIRSGIEGADNLHSFNGKASAAEIADGMISYLEQQKQKGRLRLNTSTIYA